MEVGFVSKTAFIRNAVVYEWATYISLICN